MNKWEHYELRKKAIVANSSSEYEKKVREIIKDLDL
jgi:hypothetical protein